ncbi:hypothetical protein [Curtobacterium sp. ISL-83]|uniref:hypothetical protein n=1 Tax=Curtobacterium sp. ISL-83 TaxID=2819145 RepID=UPI001BEAC240|nr:hypothetical protein [Curtobacterium sp. ISL-83]MBT2502973.1 hypothetical protein [Curtobacterium sp. ISL-83]
MALDGVPWFIGGDAEHGPDVARQLAYLATGGKEGVGGPGDLKVTALDVPGGGVKIAAGGASILNRVASQQSYTARNPVTDTSVQIAQTGSGSGRTDLVILRVDNPYVDSNAQAPADAAKGPYNRFDVIAGVPAGTKSVQDIPQYAGLSAINLARITLPASTGTVTAANITDLRSLAKPQSDRQIVTGTIDGTRVTLSSGAWSTWPINPITGIQIPSWATHAVIRMDTTIRFVSGSAYANFQGFLGPAGKYDGTTQYADSLIDATTAAAGEYRQPFIVPSNGLWPIPASLRGTTAQLTFRARAANAGGNGVIGSSSEDYYFADITFTERIS